MFLTDIVLGFFVWNLLRKLEAVEENLDELEKEYTQADTLLDSMQGRIQNAMDRMKSIDRIGSFEADDETGYFFKEMKEIVNDIAVYFGETPIDDERLSILERPKFDATFEKNY